MKVCKVDKCDGKVRSIGYCNKHYQQIKKHGKALSRTIRDKNVIYKKNGIYRMELYNIKSEVVAHTIFDGKYLSEIEKYKWGYCTGYARRHDHDKHYMLSNWVMGDFNQEYLFDHRNRNRLNNLTSNLRKISGYHNLINKSIQSNNTTGITGVYWYKNRNKYYAYITYNYKRISLGYFTNIQDAITARRKAEAEYHGEFSPNFQQEAQYA